MKISTAINQASLKLKKSKICSALLDAEILMSEATKICRKDLILNFNKKISNKEFLFFKKLINIRSKGKPIAYLTKKKFFWNHEFQISDNVLIPRPDTELIVEQVLKIFKNKSNINLLDIGVGSGCILLSILKEKKNFLGTGIDISDECLKVSKINASQLGLLNKVKFFKTDVDNFNYGKYDLIISNPPYIKKLDLKYLDKDVINFEPKIALNGGLEGISEIRKVINKSSELIKIKGKLILEIAYNQKEVVKKLLRNKNFYVNRVIKDLANNDRCIISTKI